MAVRAAEPPVTVVPDAGPRGSVLAELVRFSRRNTLAAIGGLVGVLTIVVAVIERDTIVVQNLVLLYAVIFVVINVAVDLSYAWLDPRIRYR